MAKALRVRVIQVGAIPAAEWSEKRQRWIVPRSADEDLPPRVLLDVSEEVARALGAYLYQDIEIAIRPPEPN